MKKKIIALTLIAIIGVGTLVGCSTSKEPVKEPEKVETSTPVESVEQDTTTTEVNPTEIGEQFPE